jgi:hypothetical protein
MIFRTTVLFLLITLSVKGQDTLQTRPAEDTLHSVRKATLLSTFVPGTGQIYNHFAQPKGKKNAFWKVPLIYAGLGYTGYSIVQNQVFVSSLKNTYLLRQEGQLGDEKWSFYDDNGILQLYDKYSKRRDFSIIGFILIYGLQVADAAIEAHFVHFDISENISLELYPQQSDLSSLGMGIRLNFR